MPYFLRQIDVRPWLDKSGASIAPADIVSDFKTKENKLSLWRIEDDKSNLCRVIVAISCNKADRTTIKQFEYVMIDSRCLQSKGFKINQTDGNTKDKEANKKWHYDINELSGDMLLQIVKLFYEKSQPTIILFDDVESCLKECIEYICIKQVGNPLQGYLRDFKIRNQATSST